MKKNSGRVFSLAEDNKEIPGCTVSELLSDERGFYTSVFSLGAGTDISPEIYGYPKIWYVLSGNMEIVIPEADDVEMPEGSAVVTPTGTPVGCRTENGAVYLEITLKEDTDMNSILKSSEVFALKDLVPYQEGKIVNMDLVNDPGLKFVVMSFTKGCALPEHAAPGETLIFALDGEGTIGYEGNEYHIKAGENFKFDKGGAHYVKADGNFKMALLLTLA
ncbi:MAG: cupin domain-containing protein [Lachnospiraceae bacterium]|nr:cupin domain-containing protein [Lachnospiraceae bacterium]